MAGTLDGCPRGQGETSVDGENEHGSGGSPDVPPQQPTPADPWAPGPWSTPEEDWRRLPPPAWPPTGGAPSPYPPAAVPPRPPRDGVSVAAFVTGLFGLVVVAVGLAVAGLVRTSGGRRRGRGLAVAGLVVSAVWLVISAVVAVSVLRGQQQPSTVAVADLPSPSPSVSAPPEPSESPSTPRTTPTPRPRPVPARKLYVDELRGGDCLVVAKLGDSVLKVPVVPCRRTHDAEVVGITRVPGRWHGQAALEKLANSACAKLFRGYVGIDLDSSDHGVGWFGPTADSWSHGDRLLVCFAGDDGAAMTGSLRGVQT